jgi:hypothetical protein
MVIITFGSSGSCSEGGAPVPISEVRTQSYKKPSQDSRPNPTASLSLAVRKAPLHPGRMSCANPAFLLTEKETEAQANEAA